MNISSKNAEQKGKYDRQTRHTSRIQNEVILFYVYIDQVESNGFIEAIPTLQDSVWMNQQHDDQ